jgi:hypothetical protein
MLDPKALTQMIEQQISTTVNDQVLEVLTSNEWLHPIEQKIIKYSQDRILSKFANSSTMPEIVDAVKNSVGDLFTAGQLPGIEKFVDTALIKQTVDTAVERVVNTAVEQLITDAEWVERVDRLINQSIVQRTVARLGSLDLGPIIKKHVDENMRVFKQEMIKEFASTGIKDQASTTQLTVTDETTVVENELVARDLTVVGATTVHDLVIKGAINTDNRSWQSLTDSVSDKALTKLTEEWSQGLIDQCVEHIQAKGVEFDQVKIGGDYLVAGDKLSNAVRESSLNSVGDLRKLNVSGESTFNNRTVNILNKRMGINTHEPEMALSVWDEEVSLVFGKHKAKQAYIGTNRDHGIAIGVNRIPQIEIDTDGLTTVKKLRVGQHKISHSTEVPGWSGTRGDFVFNINPGNDRVFAWVCLGGFKWAVLKSSE